jgi:hypothetical protein
LILPLLGSLHYQKVCRFPLVILSFIFLFITLNLHVHNPIPISEKKKLPFPPHSALCKSDTKLSLQDWLCNIANQIHPPYVSIQTSIPFFETILTRLKKCLIGFGDQQVPNPTELVWTQAYNSKVGNKKWLNTWEFLEDHLIVSI